MTESDISITEGSTRQIGVQRQQNLASSMSLTVFVTTIEGYKQRTQANCSKALSTLLGGDESRVDPAEGAYIPTSYRNNGRAIGLDSMSIILLCGMGTMTPHTLCPNSLFPLPLTFSFT